jgi:hypothetical protein
MCGISPCATGSVERKDTRDSFDLEGAIGAIATLGNARQGTREKGKGERKTQTPVFSRLSLPLAPCPSLCPRR